MMSQAATAAVVIFLCLHLYQTNLHRQGFHHRVLHKHFFDERQFVSQYDGWLIAQVSDLAPEMDSAIRYLEIQARTIDRTFSKLTPHRSDELRIYRIHRKLQTTFRYTPYIIRSLAEE
jgi:hypothetical protein